MKNNRKWKTTAFILTCGLTVALEGAQLHRHQQVPA